jgi:hypothetical protein
MNPTQVEEKMNMGGEATISKNSLDFGTGGFSLFRIGVGALGVCEGLDEHLVGVALEGRCWRSFLSRLPCDESSFPILD